MKKRIVRVGAVIIAAIATALSLPLIALIALTIKIDSPGPIIFKQTRIGKNRRNGTSFADNVDGIYPERRRKDLGGRPFDFYKFRTMHVDAKERFPQLYTYDYTQEDVDMMYFKIPDDPRLTRLGAHLRKTTLDELPNFINVLKGDMNIVGPRPDIPEMVEYYEEWQKKKFSVKPGVTGLAQANGRGLLSFQKTLKLDVEYVEKKSFMMDIKIVLMTIRATFLRIGAF